MGARWGREVPPECTKRSGKGGQAGAGAAVQNYPETTSFCNPVHVFLGMIQYFFSQRVFLPHSTSCRIHLQSQGSELICLPRSHTGQGAGGGGRGQGALREERPQASGYFGGRAVLLGGFQESSAGSSPRLTDVSCAFPRDLRCGQGRPPPPSPSRPQPHPGRSHPDHRVGGQGHRLRHRGSQHEGEGEVRGWGSGGAGWEGPFSGVGGRSKVPGPRSRGVQGGDRRAQSPEKQTISRPHFRQEAGNRKSGGEEGRGLGRRPPSPRPSEVPQEDA